MSKTLNNRKVKNNRIIFSKKRNKIVINVIRWMNSKTCYVKAVTKHCMIPCYIIFLNKANLESQKGVQLLPMVVLGHGNQEQLPVGTGKF